MKFRYLAALVLLALSQLALAQDSQLSSTSSVDRTDVSINIEDYVLVSEMVDILLGDADPVNGSSDFTPVCIYRNSDADVDVVITSLTNQASDNDNTFDMVHPSIPTEFLQYTVDFTGAITNLAGVASTATNTITDENNTAQNCGAGSSHTLTVNVSAAAIGAAAVGNGYSDTITVIVSPN